MKYLPFYERKGIKPDTVFDYLVSTMRPSIAGWDYFIDWGKVKREATKYTDELNLLNGLIGSTNLRSDFMEKITRYPSIANVLPVLLAVRDRTVEVTELNEGKILSRRYSFAALPPGGNTEDHWIFFSKSGIADLFENRTIKNVPDYVFGVEVGLDTNGRKNRGGHAMESLIEEVLKKYCDRTGFRYLREATADRIRTEFGYEVPVDKSSRRYDFVLDTGSELVIFEANFYGGGGSKLKSTAGEYRNLFDVLDSKFKFIWITDGAGWKKTLRPLRETFDHNDYVFNISMLEDSILDDVILAQDAPVQRPVSTIGG